MFLEVAGAFGHSMVTPQGHPRREGGNWAGGEGAGGHRVPNGGTHAPQPWRGPTRARPWASRRHPHGGRGTPTPTSCLLVYTLVGLRVPTRHLSRRLCPPEGGTGHERAPPARVGGTAFCPTGPSDLPPGPEGPPEGVSKRGPKPSLHAKSRIGARDPFQGQYRGVTGATLQKNPLGALGGPPRMGPIGPPGSYPHFGGGGKSPPPYPQVMVSKRGPKPGPHAKTYMAVWDFACRLGFGPLFDTPSGGPAALEGGLRALLDRRQCHLTPAVKALSCPVRRCRVGARQLKSTNRAYANRHEVGLGVPQPPCGCRLPRRTRVGSLQGWGVCGPAIGDGRPQAPHPAQYPSLRGCP